MRTKIFEEADPTVQAPVDAPMGQYAWPEARADLLGIDEPNTEEENIIFKTLKQHFEHNIPIAREDVKTLKQCLDNGWYSEVIRPPNVSYVYRGMSVRHKWLRNALDLPEDKKIPSSGYSRKPYKFSPFITAPATSWSISKDIGLSYAAHDSSNAIVMCASVEDNIGMLLDCNRGLYNVTDFAVHTNEKEVLALGNIKVCAIAWVNVLNHKYSRSAPTTYKRALKIDARMDELLGMLP